jgi:predicted CoA-binding protein
MRNGYKILDVEPEGKRPLGKHRLRWKDNVTMDFQEIGWEGVEWIHMAQNRDKCQALVNTVIKRRPGISWLRGKAAKA